MMAALALVRGLHLASLMLLFGSAGLRLLLAEHAPELAIESRSLGQARQAASVIALLTALAWLGLATGRMAGDPAAMTDPALLWLTLKATLFGQVMLARLAALLALAAALFLQREKLILALAGLALAMIAITSHAAAASPAHFAAIGMVVDALHLLCAGFWLGGLAVLASIMAQRPAAPRLLTALGVFAQWAMIAVALLAMTGLISATSILLGDAGHDAWPYLIVLGAKLVLVLAMTGLALVNHFRLMPALAQPGGAKRAALKRNIVLEMTLGAGVLLLAGLLGLLPPTL